MIVADASVVVDLLIRPWGGAGALLAERLIQHEPVCAPHLVDAEVGQCLRRFALRGEMSDARAGLLLEELTALPIFRYPHVGLLSRAFMFRSNVTVYDGLYLALAESLGVPLLSGDSAMRGVPGCNAVVEILPTGARLTLGGRSGSFEHDDRDDP